MSGSLLDGFTKLNDFTSIFRPAAAHKPPSPSQPCLFVYCAWMGAAPKHIAKYTDGHQRLFPNTSILLIESTLPNMLLGADLAPACEVIESFAKDTSLRPNDTENPYIILQACSNGGATNASWLANSLLKTNERLPFRRIILDCCPGKGEVKGATEAMTMQLPKQPLVQLLGSWFLYSACVLFVAIYTTMGWEDGLTKLRRRLNDPTVFSTEVPRLYMYSEQDALVNWQHVHEHAEDARQKGYSVREEKFSKAAHVALLMEDSERYWNAVKDHVLNVNEK